MRRTRVGRACTTALFLTLVAAACGGDNAAGPTDAWSVQLGTEAADTTFGLAAAPDGAIVVAGATEGSLAGPHQGGRDVYLARFDAQGAEVWSVQFGSEANDSPLGIDIAADGTIYAAGFTEGDFAGPAQGSADVWIARFGTDGTEMWRTQFGADQWDRGFGVSAHDDGAYVSGYTASVLDPDSDMGGFDAFVASFSAAGGTRWIRQYGTDATDWGQGSAATDDGLYLTGYTEGALAGDHAGDKDVFVMRIDTDGSVIWQQQFGGEGLDWTQGVDVDADGGVVLAGSTETDSDGGRDLLVLSYDAEGQQRWATRVGTDANDAVFEIRVRDETIVATGNTAGDLGNPAGDRDAILVYLDLDGEVLSIEQFGTTAVDDLTGLDIAPNGTIVYSGYTSGSLAGTSAGGTDIFVGTMPAGPMIG